MRTGVNLISCIPARCSTISSQGGAAAEPSIPQQRPYRRTGPLALQAEAFPFDTPLFWLEKSQHWGRWFLHLLLVSSQGLGTTEANQNSRAGEACLLRSREPGGLCSLCVCPTSWKQPRSQPPWIANQSANLCSGLFRWLSACFPLVSSN